MKMTMIIEALRTVTKNIEERLWKQEIRGKIETIMEFRYSLTFTRVRCEN